MVDSQNPTTDEPRELTPFGGDSDKRAAIHNFDGDAQGVWRMTAAATGPSCGDGESILNAPFPLKYYLCHEAVVNNPDKGPVRVVRTVLIDPTGNAFGFTSSGVYDSLRMLVDALGPGPYDPAVMIQVSSRQGKAGRKFYAIEPAPVRTDTPTPA